MLPKLLHSPFIWVPSSLSNMSLDYLIRAYYISFYLKKSLTKICVVDNAYYEQSLFDKIKPYIYYYIDTNISSLLYGPHYSFGSYVIQPDINCKQKILNTIYDNNIPESAITKQIICNDSEYIKEKIIETLFGNIKPIKQKNTIIEEDGVIYNLSENLLKYLKKFYTENCDNRLNKDTLNIIIKPYLQSKEKNIMEKLKKIKDTLLLINEYKSKSQEQKEEEREQEFENLEKKVKEYYHCDTLLDKSHWGYFAFTQFIIKFFAQYTGLVEGKIYIISDSTIDFSHIYTYFRDLWNNPIAIEIVDERKQFIINHLIERQIINNGEQIDIDAIGGTGYIADYNHSFNFTSFNNLVLSKTDLNIDNEEGLFDFINSLFLSKIIELNQNHYLIRLINLYIKITKNTELPPITNIICFGFGNDADYIIKQHNMTEYTLQILLKCFWNLADFITKQKINYDFSENDFFTLKIP